MSWKAQNGAWVWVADGSGNPNAPPPAAPPPAPRVGPTPANVAPATSAAHTTLADPATFDYSTQGAAGGDDGWGTGALNAAIPAAANAVTAATTGASPPGATTNPATGQPWTYTELDAASRGGAPPSAAAGEVKQVPGGTGPGGISNPPRYVTTDGKQFTTSALAQLHQDELNRQNGQPGIFGANTGLTSSQNGGRTLSDSDPLNSALSNNNNLTNRIQVQSAQDIGRLAGAGGQGQVTLDAASGQATSTGNQIYSDAQRAADAARALGVSGLNETRALGAQAQNKAMDSAAPLNTVAATDFVASADARAKAADLAARTGMTLDQAMQTVNQLLGIDTTAQTTGTLRGFNGSPGTSADLKGMPMGVSATGDLGNFTGSSGTSGALAVLDPRAGATSELGAFRSTPGTATALAGLDTHINATDALSDFSAGGNADLATLERFANGGDIGPSQAEALLREQSDQNMANSIALARSGRGAGDNAAAMRQALFSNAATQQKTGNDLAALRAKEAETQRTQNITAGTAAAGTATTQSAQKLQAITEKQTGELTSLTTKLNALVASGQMTQKAADQQLDALKAKQQGELEASGQKITALTSSGQQLQTQTAQQLDAKKAQQQGQLQAETDRLNALVAAGQMDQTQAAQRLDALKAAQQGELAAIAQKSTNVTNAAGTQVNIAQSQADLTKAFATIGLQYDVNSGQVYDAAGKIVQGGDKIAADLLGTGLSNQVGQGQVAAGITTAGMDKLTTLTNTSVDAQKASAILGVQVAGAITSLSQVELSQLSDIVKSQNSEALQAWAAAKGFTLQQNAADAQQTAAAMQAVGTIIAGMAMMSDIRAKTDIGPLSVEDWLKQNGINAPAANPAPAAEAAPMSNEQKLALIKMAGSLGGSLGTAIGSDIRAKKDITPAGGTGTAEVLSKLATPGTGAAEIQRKGQDMSFDDWIASKRGSTDVRAAKGYEYSYKDPSAPGAAPGRQFGPMAQDLEKTSAADAVGTSPNGMKYVDPNRAALSAIAGLSEQQRRLDAHEEVLKRLIGR